VKKLLSAAKGKVLVTAGMLMAGTSAFAEDSSGGIDVSKVHYNTDDVMTVAGLVLAAIAVVWGVRQAISVGRR